jgi:hypothetical protein
MLVVARDIPGSSCTGSVFVKSFMHSLQNLGVSAHAEIVIGTPDGDFLVLVVLVSAGELLGETVDVVEVAIGLVLVLLVQFGLVESLVIELGSFVLDGTDRLDLLRIWDYSCQRGKVSMDAERTILTAEQSVLDSSGFALGTGMESCFSSACLARESPDGSESSNATESHLAGLCGLHGEGLSHDGAATSNGLQIGHAATTGGDLTGRGGGGEGAKRGRGGILQKWAHCLRLAKYGVHDGRIGTISSEWCCCILF